MRSLVIDSAFFSLRTRNSDGSTWIPINFAIEAIAKSGRDAQRIRANATTQIEGIDFPVIANEYVESIKNEVAVLIEGSIKSKVLQLLESFAIQFSEGSPDRVMYRQIISEVKKMTFNGLEDIDQLVPVFEQNMRAMVLSKFSIDSLSFHGIVWLE